MQLKLQEEFYLRDNVVQIAEELIGKCLFANFDNQFCGGIICETEAYAGETDRASHAFGGRKTERTKIMYAKGGTAYIYLCYGIHSLFNVVTNIEGIPHAVLIRGIIPIRGLDIMSQRAGGRIINEFSAKGPGLVSKMLGIHFSHSGISLLGNEIWIEDRKYIVNPENIVRSKRIGVDYAGEDALLPYRFVVNPACFTTCFK